MESLKDRAANQMVRSFSLRESKPKFYARCLIKQRGNILKKKLVEFAIMNTGKSRVNVVLDDHFCKNMKARKLSKKMIITRQSHAKGDQKYSLKLMAVFTNIFNQVVRFRNFFNYSFNISNRKIFIGWYSYDAGIASIHMGNHTL